MFDMVIVGGGIMGCSVALDLAEAGMKVAIVEKATLCSGASGVNAGSHSVQIKRMELTPHALKAKEMWADMSRRLDYDIGYKRTGGLIVALTADEAALQEEKTRKRKEYGVDAYMVTGVRARQIEPLLSDYVIAASYCESDGYADTLRIGRAFTRKLNKLGVCIREHAPVLRFDSVETGFRVLANKEGFTSKRILLAAGAWCKELLMMLGVDLPVTYRLNQAMVLDRIESRLQTFIGHMSGLLTLKQSESGKLVLGGGWVAEGDVQTGISSLLTESIVGNLSLAARILPATRQTRLIRAWSGFEADMPDRMPLAGAIPGIDNAFVIGCAQGGYTIGPYLGRLISNQIKGDSIGLPIFDPARFSNDILEATNSA